jgi:uncharacterized protein YjgD (DUF1641 family)
MDKHEKLVTYYEKMLQKVEKTYGALTGFDGERFACYVTQARENLEAVKNGREW